MLHSFQNVNDFFFLFILHFFGFKDEFMQHVQEWNNIRQLCVEMALKKMLVPELIKDLHSRLLEESKEFVLRSCARRIYNWIKVNRSNWLLIYFD